MANYKIIRTYSEKQYNDAVSQYVSSGCNVYINFYGATEIYSGRSCLAVIHKEF